MRDEQMRDHLTDEVSARGLAAVLDDAVAEATQGCDALDVVEACPPYDVVEACPPYDVAEITANNAHRVVIELLAGLAVWRGATPTTARDTAGAPRLSSRGGPRRGARRAAPGSREGRAP